AVKTVAGQQAIIIDRANGFKGLAAISRAGETDVAGMHALGFLRPGHIDHIVLACTAVHNNLGTVFTIDLNGFRNSIDPYRLTVAGTVIVRMYQPGNLVLDKNYPDTAVCGLPGVGRLATVNRDICGVC